MSVAVFLAGLSMGLSLIVAIGAQNAFVLRQGLRKEHIFPICLFCALSDGVLIAIGVGGFGVLAGRLPWLDPLMRYGGAVFLAWYAAKSLRSALRSHDAMTVEAIQADQRQGLSKALLTCFAFTWLNPHVYLDTVALLGSVSTQFPGHPASFGAGAALGSFLFFFSLGYGAVWLRPIFAKPSAWRVLDGVIAAVMAWIAVSLIMGS